MQSLLEGYSCVRVGASSEALSQFPAKKEKLQTAGAAAACSRLTGAEEAEARGDVWGLVKQAVQKHETDEWWVQGGVGVDKHAHAWTLTHRGRDTHTDTEQQTIQVCGATQWHHGTR